MKTSIKTIVTSSLLVSMMAFSTISMADSMLGLECSYWKNNAMPVKKLADNNIPKHMVMNVVHDSWRDMPTENVLMMTAIVNSVYNRPTLTMEQVLEGIDTLCKEID